MKLLLLISALDCGGAETHVCALASALAANGHRVTVVSAGGRMAETLEKQGVEHRFLPLHTRNPFRLWKAKRRLKTLLREESYDLIHAHARLPAFLVASLAKKQGIPFVTTVHAHFRADGAWGRLSRWGDRSIAVGEDLKQYLCETYGADGDLVRVIPNGIDTDRFCPPSEQRTDKLRVVFLSRLDRDCCRVAELLAEIAPELYARFPTLEIYLGGGGNAYGRLQQTIDGVNRQIGDPILHLTGWVEKPERLLSSAHVFVGVSRAALEAMACGVPTILAGDEGFLGVANSVLSQGEESNFCCRGYGEVTEKVLYDALCELLSLPEAQRWTLGQELSSYVRARHSLTYMTAETEKLYEEAVSKPLTKPSGRTVLCGYYGFGNMGDEALLRQAILRARQEAMRTELWALTKNGRGDEKRFGIPCVRRTNFFAVKKALRGADRLVFGGGTLLQENTSLRSLLYYFTLLRWAQWKDIRTELWANGLGDPHTSLGRLLMRRALVGCDRVGLRDGVSLTIVEQFLGKKFPTVRREEDLALGLAPSEENRIRFLLRYYQLLEDNQPVAYAIVAPKGNRLDSHLERRLCQLRKQKLRLLFVPLFPKEDERLCHRLSNSFGGAVARGLSPADLVGLMKHGQIVLGQRLHALIFAASAETFFEGFGDDPKIQSFCMEYGAPKSR